MSVDSDRQWFVYFKETEMGPFSEPDILQKIKRGEFDGTAFVYTDGMSDWELIKDTALQKLLDSPKPRASVKTAKPKDAENLVDATSRFDIRADDSDLEPKPVTGSPTFSDSQDAYREPVQPESLIAPPAAEPIGAAPSKSAKSATSSNTSSSAPVAGKPRTLGLKALAALIFVVLIAIGYVLNQDVIDGYISGGSEPVVDLTEATGTQAKTELAGEDITVNWAELDAFVKIQDPQGPAFRLADKTIAGMRPVLIGALSPLLDMSRVTIAVFPDNEKSLYAIPPVWVWNVGVHAGYFSAGPHLNNGQDIYPGRYRVLVASQGKFLGDVGFDLGVFPIGDALVTKKTEVQKQMGDVTAKERASYHDKVQAFVALQKRVVSLEALAMQRKAARRAWLDQQKPVVKDLGDLRQTQLKAMSGPMFYSNEQTMLMAAIRGLEMFLEGLEYYSYGDNEHVKLKLHMPIEEIKATSLATLQKVEQAVKDVDTKSTFEPLKLDTEVIKARVIEESK